MEKLSSADRHEYPADIIVASLSGELDGKGEQELNEWLDESRRNRDFYESLKKSFSSGRMLAEFSGYDSVADWVLVKQKIAKRRRRTLIRNRGLYAAAVVGLLVALSVPFLPFSTDADRSSEVAEAVVMENYKALLIVSGGDVLDLGEVLELNDGGIKNDGTVLEYTSMPSEETVKERPQMHTLKVPRGAEYKVVLADGSTVHLNADSELRYPERFEEGNRTVELSGEGWFEVAHDSQRPFIVKNGDMRLEVLGTEFDFRCYADEPRTATLAGGKLRVVKGEESFEMAPGSQVYEDAGNLQLRTVDPAVYTSWRDKRFVYRSSSLEYVMNDIARWYDMEVEFIHEPAAQMRLTADIPRYENIENVLNIIRDVVYAEIGMEGGTITISHDRQ